jgi:membrane protease YdiL (CAAX protease family)
MISNEPTAATLTASPPTPLPAPIALTPPAAELPESQRWPSANRARSFLTFGGFVLVALAFVAASAGVARTLGINGIALMATNAVVLGLGSLLVGSVMRLFTPASLGLLPVRPNWAWVTIGALVSLVLLPVRAALALAGQYLVEGNLDSVMARSQVLSGDAFSPLNAVMMIGLGGICVPLAEELLFRAGVFGWLRTRLAFWPSALISAGLFGLAHYDSFGVVLSSFGLGLACAWVYERGRSIWTTFAVHAFTNLVALSFLQLALAIGIQAQ